MTTTRETAWKLADQLELPETSIIHRVNAIESALIAERVSGRNAGLEEAIEAANDEHLSESTGENDAAYDRGVNDAVNAIRALKSHTGVTDEGKREGG